MMMSDSPEDVVLSLTIAEVDTRSQVGERTLDSESMSTLRGLLEPEDESRTAVG